GLAVAVVEKAAVAVDPGIGALADDLLHAAHVQAGEEVSAARVLHTVDGPQDLAKAIEVDDLARGLAAVVGGEAAMIARVPVLRGDDQVEGALHPIGDGDNGVALRNGQSAARDK